MEVNMPQADIRTQWESAAPGWARWEETIDTWMEPATEVMLDLAGVSAGVRVLDLASGAGSQTLRAARRVGPQGQVVASDIADTMLHHVQENAGAAALHNVTTLSGAAEELDLAPASFDAVICRLALMLFPQPANALAVARRALRPGGKVAAVVFTTPSANPSMAQPMHILLRHAGKTPPAPGQPGIFALGALGALEQLLANGGFVNLELHTMTLPMQLPSAADALIMMQEAFGAYRAVVADRPETVREAAWAEVAESLRAFEGPTGFVAPAEVLVVAGMNPV